MPRNGISSDGFSVGPGNSPQLLRQLVAGRMNPHRVNRHDAAALISYCRLRVLREQAKIELEVQRGRLRIARRMQRMLLNDLKAKLVAAWDATKKVDHHRDRQQASPFALRARKSFLRVWLLARAIDRQSFTAEALLRRKPKARGGFRPIYSFDQLGIARQKLADMALTPFSSFLHQSQYTMRGRSAACEELRQQMNRATRDTQFIQFDVTNFYGSIAHEWLEEHLPLSRAIIREHVLLDNVRVTYGKGPVRLNDEGNLGMDRRGIPQGSAVSPRVAEFVMADILRRAADALRGLAVIVYCDNIGILVRTSADMTVLEKRLRRVFKTHGAGPFHLTTTGARSIATPCRFLGFHWQKTGAHVRAFLPAHVLEQRETIYRADISNAEGFVAMQRAYSRAKSFCSAFNLDQEVVRLSERLAVFLRAEIRHRFRRPTTTLRRLPCPSKMRRTLKKPTFRNRASVPSE